MKRAAELALALAVTFSSTTAGLAQSPTQFSNSCANGICTNTRATTWGGANAFSQSPTAPTPLTSDNSTKVATTAFFVAQFGQPHTWSAAQTFSAGVKTTQVDFTGAGASILGNLYYDGSFKYYANGFGAQLAFNNSTGGVAIYAAPSNSGGAGALATPALIFNLHQTGALQLPTYTTAGVLTNDASGNVTTTVGVTDSGASCTIIAITKGVITEASCAK